MDRLSEIMTFLPIRVRDVIKSDSVLMNRCHREKLSEIRLRVNCPLILMFGKNEMIVEGLVITIDDVRQCLQFISDYSLYAHEEDVSKGFITLKGGHRAGLAGQAVMNGGKVINQKNIGFINIRIAYEIKGCANEVMSFLSSKDGFKNTLIISPPACGKTTMLRDIIRQLSSGINSKAYKVGVVDERSEIAACFNGVPQNDLGYRTDVADQIGKAEGMMMLLRSMSPDIIAVDELAGSADALAVQYLFGCGCKVIATVHGDSFETVSRQPYIGELIGQYGFRRFVVLDNAKKVGEIKELKEI